MKKLMVLAGVLTLAANLFAQQPTRIAQWQVQGLTSDYVRVVHTGDVSVAGTETTVGSSVVIGDHSVTGTASVAGDFTVDGTSYLEGQTRVGVPGVNGSFIIGRGLGNIGSMMLINKDDPALAAVIYDLNVLYGSGSSWRFGANPLTQVMAFEHESAGALPSYGAFTFDAENSVSSTSREFEIIPDQITSRATHIFNGPAIFNSGFSVTGTNIVPTFETHFETGISGTNVVLTYTNLLTYTPKVYVNGLRQHPTEYVFDGTNNFDFNFTLSGDDVQIDYAY